MRTLTILCIFVVISAVLLTASADDKLKRRFVKKLIESRVKRCVGLKRSGACKTSTNFYTKVACHRCKKLFKKILIGCFKLYKSGKCKDKTGEYAYPCHKCKEIGLKIRAYIMKRVGQCKKMKGACMKQFFSKKSKGPSRQCVRCRRLMIGLKVVKCIKLKVTKACDQKGKEGECVKCKEFMTRLKATIRRRVNFCKKVVRRCMKKQKKSSLCRRCGRFLFRQLRRGVIICKYLGKSGKCSDAKYAKACSGCKALAKKLKKIVSYRVKRCLKLKKSDKCKDKRYRRACIRCAVFMGRLRAFVIRGCRKLRSSGKCSDKKFTKACNGCKKALEHFRKVIGERVKKCRAMKDQCLSKSGNKGACLRCAVFIRRLERFMARACVKLHKSGKCDGEKPHGACAKCGKFFDAMRKKVGAILTKCKSMKDQCKDKKTGACGRCRRFVGRIMVTTARICIHLHAKTCPKSGKAGEICNKFKNEICGKLRAKIKEVMTTRVKACLAAKKEGCKDKRKCIRCAIFMGRVRAFVIRGCRALRASGKCSEDKYKKACEGCKKAAEHFRKKIGEKVKGCRALKDQCLDKNATAETKKKCLRCAIFIRRLQKHLARKCIMYFKANKCSSKTDDKVCEKCAKFFGYMKEKVGKMLMKCKGMEEKCKGSDEGDCGRCKRFVGRMKKVATAICTGLKDKECPKDGKAADICKEFKSNVCSKL